jgi:hypothetical protein
MDKKYRFSMVNTLMDAACNEEHEEMQNQRRKIKTARPIHHTGAHTTRNAHQLDI